MIGSPHLHLLLNHLPTVGLLAGIAVLAAGHVRRSDELSASGLVIVFVVGVFTLPAYISGNAAQASIVALPGISADAVRRHQDGALAGFGAMMVTGLLAWLTLWYRRRQMRPANALGWMVLASALATLVLMANAAALGGAIRHPEIEADDAAVAIASGLAAALAAAVVEQPWAWPALETLHFIGLALLAAVLLPLNVRMLGSMRNVPFAALHSLLPWAIAGFALNIVSGMSFFVAAPDQYTGNAAFAWKMALILLAGVNILYLTMADEVWAVGAGAPAPLRVRIAAASGLALWLGVIFWGRLMPFLTF